ncbi:MAG: 2-hydroxychromene-2-carboxylate isomerase [Alphaproteobacteria bacterium]|nr:2-hydroxychromene-2-carboxylate isomerase [Alphaproteobacteria bacterium]
MTKRLEFFFDFTSPTAYLAWARLPGVVTRTGCEVVYRPFFLGGVMQATGNRPPGVVAAKGRWMAVDMARYAHRFGIDFAMNPHFPMNTLAAQRVAAAWVGDPRFEAYLAAVFRHAWRDGRNIGDKAVLSELVASLGLDTEEFWAVAESPETKALLKSNTDEAVERGAFGAPTFFLGEDMYFGQDRLDWIEDALKT